jgi:hypothetical protein
MMAEVKVPESSLRKIHSGLPARITVDAIPGKTYWGRVAKIGLLPDAQSMWMNPDLKLYTTQINLEEEGFELRAGMGCRAEIIVEEYTDAVNVPVQSIVRVGEKYIAYVLTPAGPKPREVEVGLDNNRMIRVLAGLQPGEKIMQTPPLAGTAKSANDTSSTRPASMTQPVPVADANGGPPAFDFRALQGMTAEERQKFLENLTPEQRQVVQDQMRRMGSRGPRDPNMPRTPRAGGGRNGGARGDGPPPAP